MRKTANEPARPNSPARISGLNERGGDSSQTIARALAHRPSAPAADALGDRRQPGLPHVAGGSGGRVAAVMSGGRAAVLVVAPQASHGITCAGATPQTTNLKPSRRFGRGRGEDGAGPAAGEAE